jgi:hypothetical protein
MADGSNDWGVSYGAIRFVEDALWSHAKVHSFVRRDDIVFEIERVDGMSSATVVLVDRYTLGLADVLRAKREFPDMDCIVTCANWNHYTGDAKQYGMENGICVFNVGEFFGSLHWTEMIIYVPPDPDKKKSRRRRRSS